MPPSEDAAAALNQLRTVQMARAKVAFAVWADQLGDVIALAEQGDPTARNLLEIFANAPERARLALGGLQRARELPRQ